MLQICGTILIGVSLICGVWYAVTIRTIKADADRKDGNTAKHEMAYLSNITSKVYHIHHDEPIPEEAVAVFVAIGRVPHTEVAKGLVDLDDDGYVMAGEDCLTSCPGVFVAGDCRTKNLRQLVTAAADGAVAGNAAVQYLG